MVELEEEEEEEEVGRSQDHMTKKGGAHMYHPYVISCP
jgi:hypothetical protein